MQTLDDSEPHRLDPVTELLLAEAGDMAAPVAVLDDVDGALTAELLSAGQLPRTWCDDLRAERAVPQANRFPTPADALAQARTVLWRLPKGLGAVDEYAGLIARHAAPDVQVLAAERDKHLNRSVNDMLARHFGQVRASRGHRKSRALLAERPTPGPLRWPKRTRLDALQLDVVAHGATFSTNRLDQGTRLLASVFDQLSEASDAIDLGCGSGILATLLARQGRRVIGIDVTWSGCDATRLTAEANGLEVEVRRRDGLADWTEPVGLIVLNPPFHLHTAKDTEPTRALIAQAGAALAEGGELWCVYNAHLPYLPWLQRAVGPTRIMARDRSYLVSRSERRTADRR